MSDLRERVAGMRHYPDAQTVAVGERADFGEPLVIERGEMRHKIEALSSPERGDYWLVESGNPRYGQVETLWIEHAGAVVAWVEHGAEPDAYDPARERRVAFYRERYERLLAAYEAGGYQASMRNGVLRAKARMEAVAA